MERRKRKRLILGAIIALAILLSAWLGYLVLEARAKRPFFRAIYKSDEATVRRYLRWYPRLARTWVSMDYAFEDEPDGGASLLSDLRDRVLVSLGRQRRADEERYVSALHLIARIDVRLGRWLRGSNAAKDNDGAIAALLIAHGADVNARDEVGWTPLHMAALADNVNLAEVLLDHGAAVNAMAAEEGWLGFPQSVMPLHFAYYGAEFSQTAALLLRRGAAVNARDASGSTPLLWATGNPENVQLLIDHGADVNVKNRQGYTALHHAARSGNEQVVELLLAHGTAVNAKNNGGETPLHYAYQSAKVIKVLLQHGAEVNAKDALGETPLHDASRNSGTRDGLEALLKAGACANARDNQGHTPLDFATYSPVSDLLRKAGGNTGEELNAEAEAQPNGTPSAK